ncbi:MAG: ABC transporter permease, partial [Acidimicrobiales bacterium]
MVQVARILVRRRVAGAVVLAIVGAALFGGSLTAMAGARRSSTALDRFLAYSRAEDVYVTPAEGSPLDMAAVDHLPQVEAAGYQSYLAMVPIAADGRVDVAAAGSINPYLRTPTVGPPDALFRRRVIRGRDLDPTEPDEAVIDEELAAARHLGPESHLRMATYAGAQLATLFHGPDVPVPQGPVVDLRITGVVRLPVDVVPAGDLVLTYGSTRDLYLSPAFYPAHGRDLAIYGPPLPGEGQGLLLRHGARDRAAFEAAVRSLPGGDQATIEVGGSDTLDAARTARGAIAVETTSLVALSVALAVAGIVLLGQGLARLVRGAATDLASLRALGVRPSQLVLVAAAPGVLTVALGVVGSAVVAILASPLTPIGLGRVAEVSPGVRVDGLVIGLGCAVLLAAGVGVALLAAVPTVRSLAADAGLRSRRSSWLVDRVAALGLPLGAALGARFAVGTPGQRRAPLRYAMGVGALALLVVAGVATYASSLDHLNGHRDEQGATWDLTIGNPNSSDFSPEDRARLLANPLVAGASAVVSLEGRGSIDGLDVAIAGLDELGGAVGPRVTSGRLPTAPGEIALGLRTASRLHVAVGDQVELRMNTVTVPITVVGTAVLNPGLAFTMAIGDGAVVSVEQVRALVPEAPVNILLARLAPGASLDGVIA